jgi:hypothetical protein
MLVLEGQHQELYDRIQERNLIRQYDLLTNCIEIGLKQGPMSFDKYTLWALNHVAVANISQFAAASDKSRFMWAITSRLISKRCPISWTDSFHSSMRIGIC